MGTGTISYFFIMFGLLLGTATGAVDSPNYATPVNSPPPTVTVLEEPPTESEVFNDEQLASCLTEKGAKFYGAFWCSHCEEQKKTLGPALSRIEYIECDAKGPEGDPQACTDAGITAYPTWTMPGAPDKQGAHSLEDLSTWSGCSYQ
jgi:hypothetical protein